MTNTEARKVLSEMLIYFERNLTDAQLEAISMAGDALEDEWISVEKELPKIRYEEEGITDVVLVANPGSMVTIGFYDCREQQWFSGGGYPMIDFTYWRYLPKAPEGEKEE